MDGSSSKFPSDSFLDVTAGNTRFVSRFGFQDLTGWAARGLAIVTCMDSRIDPLQIVGMAPGDVKILRNAGARVTDDVVRTLILASYLLGVNRVLVMPHTNCRMSGTTESAIHENIATEFGVDTRSIEFRTVTDQIAALAYDVTRLRSHPLLPAGLVVAGARYNVETGVLEPQDV